MKTRSRRPRGAAVRFVVLLLIAGVAAFLVGTRLVPRPVQPLTGRIIPGMATNAAWMDRPDRAAEAPDLALQLAGVTTGMCVADIGAGTGYMTIRMARLVGPTGKVFANEIQRPMLDLIAAKVRQNNLSNVQLVLGTADDVHLPAASLDEALLIDVYHELQRPEAILRSIRQALRPDGRLVVIEYRKEDPRVPIAATHRMSVAELRTEIEAEGFSFVQTKEALPRQHLVVFSLAGHSSATR